jgi:hypothetical protein
MIVQAMRHSSGRIIILELTHSKGQCAALKLILSFGMNLGYAFVEGKGKLEHLKDLPDGA